MNVDTAIITRWISGIAAGVIIALQGVNVGENGKIDQQIGQTEEEIHELHSQLSASVQRQKDMLEMIKQLTQKENQRN
jgi:hypothetical protein